MMDKNFLKGVSQQCELHEPRYIYLEPVHLLHEIQSQTLDLGIVKTAAAGN